nr:extracellular solute-binding protein [uncultured Dorea sp.]
MVEQFNKSQDEVEVKISYIPDEDIKKQLALAMSEGTMPDIALVDSSDFQFLHQMKPFADLTDEISELKEYSHYHLVFVHGN